MTDLRRISELRVLAHVPHRLQLQWRDRELLGAWSLNHFTYHPGYAWDMRETDYHNELIHPPRKITPNIYVIIHQNGSNKRKKIQTYKNVK